MRIQGATRPRRGGVRKGRRRTRKELQPRAGSRRVRFRTPRHPSRRTSQGRAVNRVVRVSRVAYLEVRERTTAVTRVVSQRVVRTTRLGSLRGSGARLIVR